MITKQNCLNKLKTISGYEENWNGYGARPIDDDIIDDCRRIMNRVAVYPEIFATANNSIQLEYQTDKAYVELEIFTDKYVLFIQINDDAGKTAKNNFAETELLSMDQAIRWWNAMTAILQSEERKC